MTEPPRIWDSKIYDVGTVKADRIRDAVQKAREAFWASIAGDFPEVTSGDMAPGDDLEMEWGTNAAVLIWLMYNHPSTKYATGDRATGDRAPTEADIAEAIRSGKQDIRDMVINGTVPVDVPDFSSLDNYVDRNTIGGICDEGTGIDWNFNGDVATDPGYRVQDALDAWLKETYERRRAGAILCICDMHHVDGHVTQCPAYIAIMKED